MPRPKKCRMVHSRPRAVFYKPQGIPLHDLKGVVLPLEGFEALRLADEQGLSQEEAAERMGVSRPTLCRILAEARKTVATALVHGMAIRIEGGEFMISGEEPCTFPNKRCGQKAGKIKGKGPGRGA